MIEKPLKKTEAIADAFSSCMTPEGLQSASLGDPAMPIVIFGNLDTLPPAVATDSVEKARAAGLKNPLIYYFPKYTVSPKDRIKFLDSGGDAVVDVSDIGTPEQDLYKDVILGKIVKTLADSAQQRLQNKDRITYDQGITYESASRTFFINGAPLELKAGQQKILECFFTLRGNREYVATDQLNQEIYGHGRGNLKSMRVQINKLNKILNSQGLELSARKGQTEGYKLRPYEG